MRAIGARDFRSRSSCALLSMEGKKLMGKSYLLGPVAILASSFVAAQQAPPPAPDNARAAASVARALGSFVKRMW